MQAGETCIPSIIVRAGTINNSCTHMPLTSTRFTRWTLNINLTRYRCVERQEKTPLSEIFVCSMNQRFDEDLNHFVLTFYCKTESISWQPIGTMPFGSRKAGACGTWQKITIVFTTTNMSITATHYRRPTGILSNNVTTITSCAWRNRRIKVKR